jgi:hypothetical protein
MKRFIAYTLTFALFVFWVWAPPARGQGRSQQPAEKFLRAKNRILNQYIVVLNDDTPGARVAAIASDFVGDGQNGNDCFGHGTHVAGIIGGATFGVAKGVSLHAVRVLGCDATQFDELGFGAYGWSFEQVECYVSP